MRTLVSQGEIRARDQQIATLQRRYVGYLESEDKNNGISIIAKNNEAAEYPYISTRLGCCWHGIKVAAYLWMQIHRMPLLRKTSGDSIGSWGLIQIGQDILG